MLKGHSIVFPDHSQTLSISTEICFSVALVTALQLSTHLSSHPAPGRTHHTRSSCSIACPFPLEAAAIYSPCCEVRARLNSPHSIQQQHTEHRNNRATGDKILPFPICTPDLRFFHSLLHLNPTQERGSLPRSANIPKITGSQAHRRNKV